MTKSTKTIIIAAALSLLASFPANSADIEEFQTEEYYGSQGLDIINAAEAYSKGYTGEGITIGINDDPIRLEHDSFSSKTGSKYIGSFDLKTINWVKEYHGTHVGAIAAGAKNDKEMHGVAFDANILNTYPYYGGDREYSKYLQYPEIKVVNNSWGFSINLEEIDKEDDEFDISDVSLDELYEKLYDTIKKNLSTFEVETDALADMISDDKLLVFSAGNEGQTLPVLQAMSPFFKEGVSKNLINVTSILNSCSKNPDHLMRNSDGSISGDYINAPYSSFAKFCEDYTVAAPGWNIWSAKASEPNGYMAYSGTSMAAPFVSGCAALVQQAFPYMSAKQLGDVILSTANTNINLEHQYAVVLKDNSDDDDDDDESSSDTEDNSKNKMSVNIFYFDDRDRTDEEVKEDIRSYYDAASKNGEDTEKVLLAIRLQEEINVFLSVPLQELIGQGILDVGKAVNGPAALNARRLGVENLSDKYITDRRSTLMYEIDTKGYDSEWNNDIKEIRVGKLANDSIEEDLKERYKFYDVNWLSNVNAEKLAEMLTQVYVDKYNQAVDESGLEGLHVGLLKSGGGTLKLNGNNTYEGATVVTEGTIAINGSVNGDAYSDDSGTISGKGTIKGILYNNNAAVAGDNGEGNLTMDGLESKGTLTAVVNAEGNTKFIVKGDANVDGSTVKVQGLVPGESYTVLLANSINGELANGKENPSPVTTFMSEYAKVENNEITVFSELSDELNVVDIPAGSGANFEFTKKQKYAYKAIRNMYLKLMSDLPGGVASYRGSLRASTTPQQLNQIMTLINLPAAQAAPALSAVINNAAAQSMTFVQRNSFVGDILSSHFADRFANKMLSQDEATNPRCSPTNGGGAAERSEAEGAALQSNAEVGATNERGLTGLPRRCAPRNDDRGAWFKFTYNKGEMRDGAKYRGRSGIIRYDLKLTDTKSFGLFFGHGNNTLDGFEDSWAKNKIEENRFGVYSSKKNDKYSGYLFLDYGKVDNELRRNLTNLDLSTNVKYKGDLFEIGGEYKLTSKSQKNKAWKVYPYVNMMFSRYKQDGYTENDGGIYNHVVESKTNNYAAGQIGLEFNFSNEKENYVLRLAGKHAFSGADPKLTFSFAGDMANKYELDNDQDKNHLLVSFKGERKISTDTLLSADLSMQRGSHDRDMKASLSFWRRF